MFNTIKLEKGLYNIAGKSFTQVLEEMDKGSCYENTELRGLDAFERQLKRFDIKVFGSESDMVEKFFQTTESAVLFPEFVRRCIRQGMDNTSIIPEIIAAHTSVSGLDFRGVSIISEGENVNVNQGEALPVTTVKLAAESTQLVKFGRKVSASFETIRQQRIDLFAAALRTVGAQISAAVNKSALLTLSTGAIPAEIAGTAIAYNDLISLWASFNEYNLTTILVSPSVMASILKLSEMKNYTGEYMTSGMLKTPFGATLVKCSGMSDEYLIGLDKSCALEMINGTDVVVDFDKLISTQMEDTVFTVSVGFSKIIPEAIKLLSVVKE